MLFKKEKYKYWDMLQLYIHLVPNFALLKLAYHLIKSVIPLISIIVVGNFVDSALEAVTNHQMTREVVVWLVALIAIQIFNKYMEIIMNMVSVAEINKMRACVEPALAEKKAVKKYMYYENQDSLDVMERVTTEFETKLQEFDDLVLEFWDNLVQVVGFLIILGRQSLITGVIFAITSIPSFLISYKIGNKKYTVDKELTKIDRKVKYISQILSQRETVEERYVYGYTNKMDEEYKDKFEYARVARKNVEKRGYIDRTLAGLIIYASGAIVIGMLLPAAIYPNASGEIALSIGMFTAISNAVLGLSKQLRWSIPSIITKYRYKLEYLKDLNKFLLFEEESEATACPATTISQLKSIEFRNVSFQYPGRQSLVLKNFSKVFEAGKHYAIVGINGAGKTTITKLLTKLYDNYTGEILINGKELRHYSQAEVKALTAVVYQDFCRYPLDFYHNIAIGDINSSNANEKVKNAVHTLGLDKVVDGLPQKYDTPITKVKQNGVDLSGGQWQRIALARLSISPAPIKILDEPTAALDPISECRVYEQFGEILNQDSVSKKNSITIFISHRLGSTKLADEIVVLADGKVHEQGTFDELMQLNSIYAEMYRSQASWYKDSEEADGVVAKDGGDMYACES